MVFVFPSPSLSPSLTSQVFKLYLFSRSVPTFVETLEEHFQEAQGGDGGCGDIDDGAAGLIREKFIKGFKKLAEGFSLFQQVRSRGYPGKQSPINQRSWITMPVLALMDIIRLRDLPSMENGHGTSASRELHPLPTPSAPRERC